MTKIIEPLLLSVLTTLEILCLMLGQIIDAIVKMARK
jgi:hypothetical protein